MLITATAVLAQTTPVTVFESGKEGHKSYRIPAIVTLKNGTLLAFAEGRVNNAGDFGDINIVLKRSTDQGKTWSAIQTVVNYDQLQAIMSHASLGIGSVTSAWSKHLTQIEETLKEIDELHKQYLRTGTASARNEFLAKRRTLFAKLDGQLSGLARLGTGLKNEGSIKKMLGISSKSYWHHGEIRGYEETVKRVARASEMLKKWGAQVHLAENGKEAVQACVSERYDMVLMDLQMPEMDGYEATARILEELGNAAPPIVAVTASASEQDRMDILNAGMCEHVIKPFKKETLIRILLDIQGQQSTQSL